MVEGFAKKISQLEEENEKLLQSSQEVRLLELPEEIVLAGNLI